GRGHPGTAARQRRIRLRPTLPARRVRPDHGRAGYRREEPHQPPWTGLPRGGSLAPTHPGGRAPRGIGRRDCPSARRENGVVMTDVERRQASGSHGLSERRTRALPLVGVAGTRGKSTTVWLLDAMLTAAGRSTGLWSSTGVYVRGVRQPGELGPWSRVLAAVGSGELDVALQELETPLVTSVGLPEGIYPLAGITTLCGNNEDCLLSPEFSSGALAQAIVARAVRPDGLLVLNADDLAVLEAANQTNATTVLFALHPDNPA